VGLILDGVAMERQAVEVGQLLELGDVGEPLDLVAVKVEHLQGLELEDVVTDLGDVVEAEVEPSNVFRKFHDVERHLLSKSVTLIEDRKTLKNKVCKSRHYLVFCGFDYSLT